MSGSGRSPTGTSVRSGGRDSAAGRGAGRTGPLAEHERRGRKSTAEDGSSGSARSGTAGGFDGDSRGGAWPVSRGAAGLAVLVVVVCTLVAWLTGSRGPDTYGAEAEFLVAFDVQSEQAAERLLSSQIIVIEGGGVLSRAAEELGMRPADLRRAVDASVVAGSQVIRVSATGATRERATEVVTAVTDAYLSESPDDGAARTVEYLTDELDAATAQRTELERQLAAAQAATGDAAGIADLRSRIDRARERESSLQDEVVRTEVRRIEVGQPRIVTAPRPLEHRVAPTPLRSAALGLLAGLALAAGVLLVAARSRASRADR
jgi:capsular polysaccharide biosynthesis protein